MMQAGAATLAGKGKGTRRRLWRADLPLWCRSYTGLLQHASGLASREEARAQWKAAAPSFVWTVGKTP